MTRKECLDRYFSLMKKRPNLFADSDIIPIVKDRETIEKYIDETGKHIGVIYQSQYNAWVVDLICDKENNLYTYERAIPSADGRGVVCIPIYKGQYILLNQYRHAIRETQLCFPRGYGETGMSSYDNVSKELYEEIGASVKTVRKIGEIVADSGLSSSITDVYVCEIESYSSTPHTEGIADIILCSQKVIKNMISQGTITDSFTVSAFTFMQCTD